MFRSLFTVARIHKRHQTLRQERKLLMEGLETRNLMAANITASLDTEARVLRIEGTARNDTIEIKHTASRISLDGVSIRTSAGMVDSIPRSQIRSVIVSGLGGDDVIKVTETNLGSSRPVPLLAWGGGGQDTITGGSSNDKLQGGSGNDQMYGVGGNDRVVGEDGNDMIEGGDGNDELIGCYYGNASEVTGNDTILGGWGDDWLYGGDGADKMVGQDGHDFLKGDGGNDILIGCYEGNGSEFFGNDTILGGAGNDELYGGDGNDKLIGEDGDDFLKGDKGNDILIGCFEGNASEFSGKDTILGGWGNDWLYGGDGADKMVGEDGHDFLKGDGGNDILIGCYEGNGSEVFANDTILGGAGNDELYGGDGTDKLIGEDGDDFLKGDNGNDILIGCFEGGAGEISGNDRLYGGAGNDELYGGDGNDRMVGEDGDDFLKGDGGNDILIGCHDGWAGEVSGNDRIFGGAGNDELYGGDGDDTMAGEDGDDYLLGERGNDTLVGCFIGSAVEVSGRDRIFGGPGNDQIFGGDGNDFMAGEDGDDVLHGENGEDVLIGAFDGRAQEVSGNDTLFGGAHNDWLFGGDGDDTLEGEAGIDNLFGENGNDNLYGGDHDDWLYGGWGLDGLYGGMGANQLRGEGNADRFLMFSPGDNAVDAIAEDATVRFLNTTSRNSATTSGVPGTMYWEAGFWNDHEIMDIDRGLRWLHTLTGNTRLLKTHTGGQTSFERWGAYVSDPNGNGTIDANEAATNAKGQTFRAFNRGSGRMAFTQACMSSSDRTIATIVIHEAMHNFDTESVVWGKWLAASGWHKPKPGESTFSKVSGDGQWRYDVTADDNFYREYSRWNPMEDWATTFEAYYRNSIGALDSAAATRLSYKFELINEFLGSMR